MKGEKTNIMFLLEDNSNNNKHNYRIQPSNKLRHSWTTNERNLLKKCCIIYGNNWKHVNFILLI
jgi:hypothetical protein